MQPRICCDSVTCCQPEYEFSAVILADTLPRWLALSGGSPTSAASSLAWVYVFRGRCAPLRPPKRVSYAEVLSRTRVRTLVAGLSQRVAFAATVRHRQYPAATPPFPWPISPNPPLPAGSIGHLGALVSLPSASAECQGELAHAD